MKKFNSLFLLACLLCASTANFVLAGETNKKRTRKSQEPLKIKVSSVGLSRAEVESAQTLAENTRAVQTVLKRTKHRLMSVNYDDRDAGKLKITQTPINFRAVYYDYTNDKTFVAESDFAGTKGVSMREEKFQPGVSSQEIMDGFEVIKSDAALGALFKQNKLKLFEAMPPITVQNGERLVNVGVKFLPEGRNEVVGIGFKDNRIVRYKNNAPPTAQATADDCGITSANQGNTPNGTPGQYQLIVTQNNQTLWEMVVIRPSASSGNPEERSGIEVRDVKYKGKSVLKRGNAPILTVQYDGDQCGPYRDWQYAEGYYNVPEEGAIDPSPGIRIVAPGKVPQTSLESGVDAGNFAGVAVYTQNEETILVTEMDAGWYRYISEWRFAADGTIRPRYGFGSTNSSCVCFEHHHNIYWRFDFDVVSPTNNIFQIERGRKFMKPITTETAPLRNYQTNRSFLIQNSDSDEAYLLVPGLSDGVTNDFGGGDFWLLKYHALANGEPDELDDENGDLSKANLTPWLNDESLVNQDIVVWYAGHYDHNRDGETPLDPNHNNPDSISGLSHVVGPTLRPVRW